MMRALLGVSVVLLSTCLANSVIIRDYNKVNYKEYDTYAAFAKIFLYGDRKTVNQNVFVGIATPECADKLESPVFRGSQSNGGGNVIKSVSVPRDEFPGIFEHRQCAEILFYRIGDNIYFPTSRTDQFDHTSLNRWSADSMGVQDLQFVNRFPYAIEVFWHDEGIPPIAHTLIQPNETGVVSTYLGHIFSASRVEDSRPVDIIHALSWQTLLTTTLADKDAPYMNVVDYMVVDEDIYEFSPRNRLEACEYVEGRTIDCSDMKRRFMEFTHRVWYEKRLGVNFVQPQLVKAVTHNGFQHQKLPAETYAWLKAWYHNEQLLAREQQERYTVGDMNPLIAPSTVTRLSVTNKRRLSKELRPTLEGWYGGKLNLTSIYGVRKYINGSVLRMSVDTVSTHVVSAIINVDQEVDEDWPLLILDHDFNEHNIIMKPGDMLLYEGAKLLHGRPETFKGSRYAEIFIHYKPVSGWDYSWL